MRRCFRILRHLVKLVQHMLCRVFQNCYACNNVLETSVETDEITACTQIAVYLTVYEKVDEELMINVTLFGESLTCIHRYVCSVVMCSNKIYIMQFYYFKPCALGHSGDPYAPFHMIFVSSCNMGYISYERFRFVF